VFKLDQAGLHSLLNTALDKESEKLKEGFKVTLESEVFVWSGTTHRKSGEIVGPVRNAVDLGNLRDSIEVENLGDLKRGVSFSKDYADKVLGHANVDLVEFTLSRIK
jgi:hypothetical protein